MHFLLLNHFFFLYFLSFFFIMVEYESFITKETGKEVVLQKKYKGLLLSSCQSVPMFSNCHNMKAVKQRGEEDEEGKRRSPEKSNFDCRQLREKWLFFTEEVSIKGNPIISVIAPYPFRCFDVQVYLLLSPYLSFFFFCSFVLESYSSAP